MSKLSFGNQFLLLWWLLHIAHTEAGSAPGGVVVAKMFDCIGQMRRYVFSIVCQRFGDKLLQALLSYGIVAITRLAGRSSLKMSRPTVVSIRPRLGVEAGAGGGAL